MAEKAPLCHLLKSTYLFGGQGYLKLGLSSEGSEQELLELQGSFDLGI